MASTDTVYNLEVAEYHTYFVGNGELWVHNTSPCNPKVVTHPSQRAARRAAQREAGIPAGAAPDRTVPSRPGSRPPSGPSGTRSEWSPVSDAQVGVHHDPHGHLFPDGTTIPPHFGVDSPDGPTVHHVYPSAHDPSSNR